MKVLCPTYDEIAKAQRALSVNGVWLLRTMIAALFFCLAWGLSFGQTNKERFMALSPPMKRWTITHPFVAKKALMIGQQALAMTDSIREVGTLGQDYNGGLLDAYRHGIWMALLTRKIGGRMATNLGRAYERGNYWQFKKGQLEDNAMQDAVASEMDLLNNAKGIEIGQFKELGVAELSKCIVEWINSGQFWIVSKDIDGNSKGTNGKVIPKEQWQGKWLNQRCLVPSL